MKNIKSIIGLLAIAGCLTLNAQTNAPVVTTNSAGQVSVAPASFPSQVMSWVGNIDTNSQTFTANRGSVWTGADYVQGVTVANSFGLEYKFGTNSPWAVQSVTRNAGIAGTIVGQEVNIGYSLYHHYDLDLSALAGGGYTWPKAAITKGAYGDVKLEIKKAMASRTFVGADIEEQLGGHGQNAPIIGAFAGFTF